MLLCKYTDLVKISNTSGSYNGRYKVNRKLEGWQKDGKAGFGAYFGFILGLCLYDCAWFAWDREVVGER